MFNSLSKPPLAALGALVGVAALALTGCSGAGAGAVPGAATTNSASDTSSIVEHAPVAADDLIVPDSTMKKIKNRGVLRVGAALDAPLLSQQDPTNPDNISGFDITMAKMLAKYILGEPKIEVIPPASETREALLANGTVDVVFNTYTINEKRATQISFAGPYFSSGLAVAVKADRTDIKSIDDLGGKTVIVGANTPAVQAVPGKQPTAKLVDFATDPQAVQALLQGRGDAYVQDYTLLASNAAKEKGMKIVGEPFTVESYGIGLKLNDQQFKTFINNWLTTIQENGQWGEVWEKTLGTVTESNTPTPPKIGSVPGS
ncbi:glutamate ABC transporter substrate-binding protein [Arthrobacter oryzae]|uniref:glutamate ABC transporter substrate-binding protein n=1 Tax=Arthrobacter oryzae TaxID=409290 RepID=UPI00285C9BB2|nr:glutamate ABC transporter substrate-binding protein [Arthrobacter oryzae]MDR6507656.1 glutamate transport system substrate-binding protein [Arthrobacter oryzae]